MYLIFSIVLSFLTNTVSASRPINDIKPFFISPKGFGLITTSMPLTKVLHQYAKACDKNVYIDAKISGTVKARIKDVSCDDLLEHLSLLYALKVIKLGDSIQIVPEKKGPKVYSEIKLKHLFASDARAALKGKVSTNVDVWVKDAETLAIKAAESQMTKIKFKVRRLDQLKFQARVHVLISSKDGENIIEGGVVWPKSFPVKMPFSMNEVKLSVESYAKKGVGRILSSPSVLMTSGKSAKFEVVDELPFDQSDGFGGQLTVYKKAKFSISIKADFFQDFSLINYSLRHDRAWMQIKAPSIHSSTAAHSFRAPYQQTMLVASWLQKHEHKGRRCLGAAKYFKHIKPLFCFNENKSKYEIINVYILIEPVD